MFPQATWVLECDSLLLAFYEYEYIIYKVTKKLHAYKHFFETELWSSGVLLIRLQMCMDLQVMYWLVPKQFSHFPAKCISCCSQVYLSAKEPIVVVSGSNL